MSNTVDLSFDVGLPAVHVVADPKVGDMPVSLDQAFAPAPDGVPEGVIWTQVDALTGHIDLPQVPAVLVFKGTQTVGDLVAPWQVTIRLVQGPPPPPSLDLGITVIVDPDPPTE